MDETNSAPIETCPECGAAGVDGMTCWERLGAIGAWEFQDPELMAEHFLTVASYNLQHPARFTDEALAALRSGFIKRMDRGTPVEELRRRAARAYAGYRRVLKEESERKPVLRPWSMTIADVYIPDKPQGFGAERRCQGQGLGSKHSERAVDNVEPESLDFPEPGCYIQILSTCVWRE